MSETELVQQENAAPALAVQALTSAHRRVRASGRSVVLVAGGKLVRVGPLGSTPLKDVLPRVKVSVRTKRAKA